MDKMGIYRLLPVWAQNLACSLEGARIKRVRYDTSFQTALRTYEDHNRWSYDQICAFRDDRLKKLVRHCYDTVPYYHRIFDECGINPDTVKSMADLRSLPILTKEVIRNNPSQFLSSSFRECRLTNISTSGSTGTSLVLKVVPQNIAEQYAIWWRYRRRLGIEFDTWHSEFGSRIVVPVTQIPPPHYRTSVPLRQVMFSAFHGNQETFWAYYEKIKRDKFLWIHGTPSVLIPFASFCVENNLSFDHQFQFVTTGAENLYDFQRKILARAFGVIPHTHYGLTEAVANFSENVDGVMEVDEDFAAVEFLPEDDHCRIVGTSLINYSMPLLRYDTGDICMCTGKVGRYGRIVERLDGRNGDCVFLPNGTRVATLSALFSETENILEAQIHQLADYSLNILFVSKNDSYDSDLRLVKTMLADRIGGHLPITFTRVDKIPRTARGKLRYIVSDLKASK